MAATSPASGVAVSASSSGAILIRATLAAAASRALGFPLTLLISAWLARSLTRPEFAFFGVLTTFSVLFATVAQMGYQSGIVRQLGETQSVRRGESPKAIYLAAVLVTLGAGAVLAAFATACAVLLPAGLPVAPRTCQMPYCASRALFWSAARLLLWI